MTPLQQELINRQYKRVNNPHNGPSDVLFYKTICDAKNIKYCISVWYYPACYIGTFELPESIQVECHFPWGDGVTNEEMRIQLFTKDIDAAERVFENIWVKLKLDYHRNQ